MVECLIVEVELLLEVDELVVGELIDVLDFLLDHLARKLNEFPDHLLLLLLRQLLLLLDALLLQRVGFVLDFLFQLALRHLQSFHQVQLLHLFQLNRVLDLRQLDLLLLDHLGDRRLVVESDLLELVLVIVLALDLALVVLADLIDLD